MRRHKQVAALLAAMVLGAILTIVGFVIPARLQPAEPVWASPLINPAAQIGRVSGPSVAATGTLTGNEASKLSFSDAKNFVIVTNPTGSTAYIKFNDITTTVTITDYDVRIDNGEEIFINGWLMVENVTVFVTPTDRFRMVGW